MIHAVEGDILLSKAEAIAHGVAPNDPMNQGLALSLRERYPAMHKDYHHWCHQHGAKPGDAWVWGGVGGVRIINLITQPEGPGHKPGKADLHDVNYALRALKRVIAKEKFTSVALPRLATGVGGLDWADVEPLIEQQLGDLDIPIYVYIVYHPDQTAKEKA